MHSAKTRCKGHNPCLSLLAGRPRHVAWAMAQLLLLLLALTQPCVAQEGSSIRLPSWRDCDSETQMVMCGQIPYTAEFRTDRLACCRLYRPVALPAQVQAAHAVVAAQQSAMVTQVQRGDLTNELLWAPHYYFGKCTTQQQANVPTFQGRAVTNKGFAVPQLTKAAIQRVKAKVYLGLTQSVKDDINRVRTYNSNSGFTHPGTCAGAMELALMKFRLNTGHPIQSAARDSLLNGVGVRPKTRTNPDGSTWAPPTNCPAHGYYGPLPVQKMQIKWSGINYSTVTCPSNYPAKAPTMNCGHISFIELDAQMTYKMAVAWYVTNDDRYANKVFQIVDAWANTNKEWGLRWENGPLEAGWGIAAMARALELLRHKAPSGLISRFVGWVKSVPMKDMDYYIDDLSSKGITNFYGNWHSTIAECYMAVGILADDKGRYDKGVRVFHATVQDYLKWGKGNFANGRILGECSETMRDMYHAQFGLGGLLQAAEMAWQQDEDIYSSNGYALAAAMELHARVTNAFLNNKNPDMLPAGFKYYDGSMPQPPSGTRWQFDTKKQLWTAVYTSNGAWHSDLKDNIRYMLGIGFLPTGWEVGFNHYTGRLGMKMPETAALLARSWPEWQEFHWGLGTITHAHTAQTLWRDGVKDYTLCGSNRISAAAELQVTPLTPDSAYTDPLDPSILEKLSLEWPEDNTVTETTRGSGVIAGGVSDTPAGVSDVGPLVTGPAVGESPSSEPAESASSGDNMKH